MEDRIQRLSVAYEYLRNTGKAHTQKDVASAMVADKTTVSQALKGNENYLTDNFMQRFNTAFGDIFHLDWLLTGEGEMLKSDQFKSPAFMASDETTAAMVPLLPISAQGGSLNDFVVSIKDSDCEKIVSPIKGADFAMSVAGDSMAPEYPAGSQILIKKINERAFIDWGKVYVLDTCNGSVIKKLFPADDPGKIKCVSINPDYPPFEVSLEDVYGVYRVMLCMAIK